MMIREKYDKLIIGIISGFLFPFIIGVLIFAFSAGHTSLYDYLGHIYYTGIVTHAISLCVFPNVIIFLVFNRFDMLRAAKGVLGATIVWAIIVFAVKFLL